MHKCSRRIGRTLRLASVVALLASAWPAQAAVVYVQAPGGLPITDPMSAQVAGSGFEAAADLVNGRFGASGEYSGIPSTTWTVRSGTLAPVKFTNTGATAISGVVSAHVTGSYSLIRGSGPNDVVSTQVYNILSGGIDFTSTEFHAEAVHTLVRNANQSVSLPTTQVSGGGVVSFGQTDFSALDALLSFPFTLGPGQRLSVSYLINPAVYPGNGGHAVADFCCSAQLSMVLPVGAEVSNDTGQTLNWVTVVPGPPTLGLLMTGFAVALTRSRFHRGNLAA